MRVAIFPCVFSWPFICLFHFYGISSFLTRTLAMCDEVHHFILVPSLKDLFESLCIWVPGQMKFGAWVQALVVHGEDQTKELEDVGTVPSCWTHEVCFSSFTCFLWTCETCLYKWGGQRLTFLHVCVCTWLCIVGNAVQLRMCTHVGAICQCGYLWLLALFWGAGPLTELCACLATW